MRCFLMLSPSIYFSKLGVDASVLYSIKLKTKSSLMHYHELPLSPWASVCTHFTYLHL